MPKAAEIDNGGTCSIYTLPIVSIVVPFWGSYIESYRVIPKRNYYGAYGYFIMLS